VSSAHHADRSSRRRSSPNLHAHNSALSRCYINMLVCQEPCPRPTAPASMSSPVPNKTDPVTIHPGSVLLAPGVNAAAAAAVAALTLKAPDVAGANGAAVRHASCATPVSIAGERGAANERRSPAGVARVPRRRIQRDRLPLSPRAQHRAIITHSRVEAGRDTGAGEGAVLPRYPSHHCFLVVH